VKRRVVRLLQKYVINPPLKAAFTLGLAPPSYALIETIGRKSGNRWRNPVGNGLDGDGATFWIVAEHGHQAGYVRNIAADPHVRVKIGRHWRAGVAVILDEDDPRARLRAIGKRVNAAVVRAMGTNLLTIRVDLEPRA